MTNPRLCADLAIEWWLASGARTAERAESLCQHFGTANGLNEESVNEAQLDAVARLRKHGYLT